METFGTLDLIFIVSTSNIVFVFGNNGFINAVVVLDYFLKNCRSYKMYLLPNFNIKQFTKLFGITL